MPDMLDRDNVGPSRIANFSYMPFSKLDHGIPLFSCLKIEAYDHRGKKHYFSSPNERIQLGLYQKYYKKN